MKKIFIPALSAILLFAGCQKNEMNNSFGEYDAPEYVTASVPATKVHLDGLKTSWHSSDDISLFTKGGSHNRFIYDEAEEGQATMAQFKFKKLMETGGARGLENNFAVYPFRDNADNSVSTDGVLTTRIVNGQNYNADNLLDYAPMVAAADAWDFTFVNVGSVLRFNVRKSNDFVETCVLNTIKLESVSGQQYLSGSVSVDTKQEQWAAVCDGEFKNANVNLKNINVELSEDFQSFCIAVFPTTFPANDLRITLVYNDDAQKIVIYPASLTLKPGTVQDINCTMNPEITAEETGVNITTGDIYKFNDHPHLTCYTASVEGGVTVVDENVTVSELGVLFQRGGKEGNLVVGNVGTGTNDVRQVKASSVKENVVLRLTNLVGGSDGATKYVYRFYAVLSDESVVYGATKEFRTDVYGFVPVKAGTFIMGADSGQSGYYKDGKTAPAHSVQLTKDYEISKYELSVPQFAEFLNAKNIVPSKNTETELTAKIDNKTVYSGKVGTDGETMSIVYKDGKWDGTSRKKYPIERVTKFGAEQYCIWLTEIDTEGYTYRLPTEAEWEWAAMGGINSKKYTFSGSNTLSEVGVYKNTANSTVQKTTAVLGNKYPNELGIYDMSGNLWEVVADRCDKNWLYADSDASYYQFCKDQGTVVDPQGPVAEGAYSFGEDDKYYCIRKGGSVNDAQSSTDNFSPHYRREAGIVTNPQVSYGFRIVRVKN